MGVMGMGTMSNQLVTTDGVTSGNTVLGSGTKMSSCDFSDLNPGDYASSSCSISVIAHKIGRFGYTPRGMARVLNSTKPNNSENPLLEQEKPFRLCLSALLSPIQHSL